MFTPLLPGFYIALFLAVRACKADATPTSLPVIYSFSHLLGIIFFSIAIQCGIFLNLNVFNEDLFFSMLILLGIISSYVLIRDRRLLVALGKVAIGHMAFVFMLALLWGNQPVFGWDALKFWMPAAVDLIDVGSSQDIGWRSAKALQHRHMATIPSILSWTAWVFERFSQQLLTFNIGFHFAFFLAVFAAHHWRKVTGKISFSILGATAVLTLPLMESHILISGYAEIWLACYLAAAATAGVMFLEERTRINLLFFLGLTSSIALLKNIGFIFALTLGASMFLIRLNEQETERSVSFNHGTTVKALGYSSLLVLLVALCITLFNSQGAEYDLAGRVLKLQLNNPLEVLAFQANALIFNSSYSLLVFLFLISLYLWVKQRRECQSHSPRDLLFFTTISLYLIYSFGQLFTDYIYFYSSLDNDTSGSRLFLPIAALAIMCAPQVNNLISSEKS